MTTLKKLSKKEQLKVRAEFVAYSNAIEFSDIQLRKMKGENVSNARIKAEELRNKELSAKRDELGALL